METNIVRVDVKQIHSISSRTKHDGQSRARKLRRNPFLALGACAIAIVIALAVTLPLWFTFSKNNDKTSSETPNGLGSNPGFTQSTTSTTSTTSTSSTSVTTTTTSSSTTSETTTTTSETTSTTTSSVSTTSETTTTATTATTATTSTTITTTTTTAVPPNLLTNPGAESTLTGWTQTGPAPAIQDTGGSINGGYNPRTGSGCFAGGFGAGGSTASLFQKVNLLGGPQNFSTGQLDAGTLKVELRFYYQNYYSWLLSTDEAQVTIVFRSATNTALGTFSSGPQICGVNAAGWCLYSTLQNLPVGTRSIDYTMSFIRNGGTDIDSYIDDNSLRVI